MPRAEFLMLRESPRPGDGAFAVRSSPKPEPPHAKLLGFCMLDFGGLELANAWGLWLEEIHGYAASNSSVNNSTTWLV